MPFGWLRRLSGKRRSAAANRDLGLCLAFVAGAANAGGFLAVHQYTSHMTGIVSALADDVALGHWRLAWGALLALGSFIAGAAACALLVNWARLRNLQSEFALALLCEAVLLLLFGLVGAYLSAHWGVLLTIALLCFIMGLQNAIITKISQAQIRTTHVTGLVTDIGIELGRALYWNQPGQPAVRADWGKCRLLLSLLAMFFIGGVLGALGFKHIGFAATIPLAIFLLIAAVAPVLEDMLARWRAGA
ncbi:YoaK family protein [Massilia sp. W12]|uniref:YoaK family protein n=1 Tax=Massilia sp. W12 TaxID=3126507 RepID=UPI0030D38EE9